MAAPKFEEKLVVTLTVDMQDKDREAQYIDAFQLVAERHWEANHIEFLSDNYDGPSMVYKFEVTR